MKKFGPPKSSPGLMTALGYVPVQLRDGRADADAGFGLQPGRGDLSIDEARPVDVREEVAAPVVTPL